MLSVPAGDGMVEALATIHLRRDTDMTDDTGSVVGRIYAAWTARDLQSVLQNLADDMVFALHIPAEVMPLGGETRGKAAVAAALQGLFDSFDFLAYDVGPISTDGATATCENHFRYRHKGTGDVIDGRLRHRWQVESGRARRLDEWHDVPAVKAYFDRVALNLAAKSA
jgi:ketosteroid isomerase-like protein